MPRGYVNPTKFDKNLAASNASERKQTFLLNKATMMVKSSENYNFLFKSLWVQTAGIRNLKLRDLVTKKADCGLCKSSIAYSDQLQALIKSQLDAKYLAQDEYFDAKVSSDIMYNEPRQIVSIFKDYLIFDDFSEYMKRAYRGAEVKAKLPRMAEYYNQ